MKSKGRLQAPKRLLSILLAALMVLTPVMSETAYAAEEETAQSQLSDSDKAAETGAFDGESATVKETPEQEISDSHGSGEESIPESDAETSDVAAQETDETVDETESTASREDEALSEKDAAESEEAGESREGDSETCEEEAESGDDVLNQGTASLTDEIYGSTSDYTGAWAENYFVAGTYKVTANLSMPGQYNPLLKNVTVYANNPNNPFGPVLDPNDPAENVANSAPTTPLTDNATLQVAADGTLTLTLPVKNPVFTTQKIGECSSLAFKAEKLAGPYTYGTYSVDSRIYKLTATLGKAALSDTNVATYTFKGSELYALPLGMSIKPTGDIALQLDVDLSAVPVKVPSDTDGWTKKEITDEATGITMTASTDPEDGMFRYGEELLCFMAADASAEDTSFAKMYAVAPYYHKQVIPTWAISTSWYLWTQGKCQFDFTVPASGDDSLFYLVETDTDGNKTLTRLDAVIRNGKASFTLLPKTMTEAEAKALLTKLYAAAYNYAASSPNSNYDSAAKAYIAETTEKVVSPNVVSCTYNGTEQTGVRESAFYTVKSGTVKATKAGTYKATLELSEDARAQGFSWKNAEGDTLEVTWQIKKKELEVLVNDWRDPGRNIRKNDLEDFARDNISGIRGFADGEDSESASGYVAPVMIMPEGYQNLQPGDSFDISFTEGKADNYYFTYPSTTFHILNPCLDNPTPAELTYNGQNQSAFDSSYSWADSTKVNGQWVTLDAGIQKDAGKYKSELGILGYPTEVFKNGTGNSDIIEWEIKPAVLTVTYKSETVNANGKPKLEVEVTGFVNGETAETAEDYEAPTVTAPENLEAGEVYTLTPEGGSAKNYVFCYVSGDLTVEKEKELKAGTYTITANLIIKGENNQVLDGVQIYPGTTSFPPVVPGANNARLVVEENGDKYLTLYFYPSDDSENLLADASEVFTMQELGDGTNIKVTDTKKEAGPSAPYGEYKDRIVEATFKVNDYSDEFALGKCAEYPTIMEKTMSMPIHLQVDWDSAVRSYVEPEETEKSWSGTYTDEATGVAVTITSTEKTVGEKLDKAGLTVVKESDAAKLQTMQEVLEQNYNGSFNFGIYDIALNDADGNRISLDGNTKADISFTTASKTADLYRKKGKTGTETIELKKSAENGKVLFTVSEKLGQFVLVESEKASRWFTKTFTDSTTDINTTVGITNAAGGSDEYYKLFNYSTKVSELENGDKTYAFGYGSPLEPMFGPSAVDFWSQGQTYVRMDVAAGEGTKFYLVTEDNGLTQAVELSAEIKDGRAKVDVIPLDLEKGGDDYLQALYYSTKNPEDISGNYKTAYVLATKEEKKFASAPITGSKYASYTGLPQAGYIDGEHYRVVSGNKTETDAGTYNLTVKPEEGYTWTDGTTDEKTITWVISKVYLTVKAEKSEYLTDPGVLPDVKYTVSGFVNGETEETAADYVAPAVSISSWSEESFQSPGRMIDVSVGSNASAKNYYFSPDYDVDVYTRMTTWPENMEKGIELTYTGKNQYHHIYNSSNVYVIEGEKKAKAAGEYKLTISLSEEYKNLGGTWPNGGTEPIEVTWKIKPAVLTASYISETIDAGGTPALETLVTGFVNNESAETIEGYEAPSVEAPESLEGGKSYELTPSGGTASNYTFDYVAGTLTVNAGEEPIPEPTPTPDDKDELAPGTYQITANVYLPGELNTQLQGVTAYMTNPDNPVGIGGHTGIPNTPVSDNARLIVGNDGSRTIVVDLVNPVFTLQKISSGNNIDVLAAQRDNETYSGNTGVSRNGRITTLYLKLKDNSGTYQFGDCTEFPTLLEADWNAPLRLGVDFASAKKLSDNSEVTLPDGKDEITPTPTPTPTPAPAPDNKNNTGSQTTQTVTKLKPGTYKVTANIWFNKADTGLPMNPHITSSVFPPKDPIVNNATLVVDAGNHAYVTVPIAIQSRVMTVRSINGLNITDIQRNADGAITGITVDLGILENPDAVITKACRADIWMGDLAMSISGFSKEHSWPATFQLSLSGVATESGSASADGIIGTGTLTTGVKTGDNSSILLYAVLLGGAFVTMVSVMKKKKSHS